MKEKIPFYEIANMFFTGASFSVIFVILFYNYSNFGERLLSILSNVKDWSIVVSAALLVAMYEIGFILNKISSVLLGKLLEKTIWPREKYDVSVSQIEEKNSKFKSLNTELHVTRTHIVMYLIFFIISLFLKKWFFAMGFFAVSVIFIFAGRRTNNFMNKIKKGYMTKEE